MTYDTTCVVCSKTNIVHRYNPSRPGIINHGTIRVYRCGHMAEYSCLKKRHLENSETCAKCAKIILSPSPRNAESPPNFPKANSITNLQSNSQTNSVPQSPPPKRLQVKTKRPSPPPRLIDDTIPKDNTEMLTKAIYSFLSTIAWTVPPTLNAFAYKKRDLCFSLPESLEYYGTWLMINCFAINKLNMSINRKIVALTVVTTAAAAFNLFMWNVKRTSGYDYCDLMRV